MAKALAAAEPLEAAGDAEQAVIFEHPKDRISEIRRDLEYEGLDHEVPESSRRGGFDNSPFISLIG